ncbi:hypothetical protein CRG98_021089 [Punica granatum]|uniref:Lysine-specific demethylase JMJ25 n=1 Tax=Punica granatum TaxID=22663 RepID=A0A2I0JQF5_PUNGR|nr:hypothetical protein CRG98_021089 [Punica granatum]
MAGKEALPEHLRCNRTDGRSWRCGRPVKEGKKLCEIHYLQGLHRQHREKVPESLKIQRQYTKKLMKKSKDGLQIRAQKIDKSVKRSVKLKRRNLARELVRMVVTREVEKRKETEEGGDGDMMRRLPNGIMVISQSPARPSRNSCNAGTFLDVKVGANPGIAPRRRFRSKNIEPVPIGSVQVLPYKRNGESVKRGGGRKKCHWCKSSDSSNLIKCSNCRKEFYCMECIKERYFDTQEEVKMQCPVCRRTCSCKACVDGQSQATSCQELSGDESRADRILSFHYLICALLPILKQINEEQSIELELEAAIKGLEISELQVNHHEFSSEPPTCNNCKSSIVDLHRRCSNCSYILCLSCWWDFCQKVFPEGMKVLRNACANKRKSSVLEYKELNGMKLIRKHDQENGCKVLTSCLSLAYSKACNSVGGISCPVSEFGGCGNGVFDLRSSFPVIWIKELESKAEEIVCSYDFPEAFNSDSCCSICDGANYRASLEHLQQAAMRKYSNDNLLYYPSSLEVCADKREHFQKHWGRGHPVVVHDVLQKASDLSWDPVVMFYTYLEGSIAKHEGNQGTPPCLECCEVEISIKQFFWGPLRGRAHQNTGQEMLKLKAWFASRYFREQFPRHYSEIIHQLPLQEYVNPESGILNLASKSQLETLSPELGPYVYISYNSSEEHMRAHCVLKLGYDLYDTVNILAHTTDDLISSENLNKIRKLMRKHQAQNERDPTSTPDDQFSRNKGEREPSPCAEDSSGLTEMSIEELLLQHKISRVSWVSSDELPSPSYQNGSLSQDRSPVSYTISESGTLKAIQNSEESPDRNFCTDGNGYLKKDSSKYCGAQWDIFRREDVPKLMEYFRRHSSEFVLPFGSEKNAVHPILDQCFFLDEAHKTRLKEEFKIEPWTVLQHVGEAVMVPLGCPYQIRNLKSCVSVVLHFISPESVKECIHVMDGVHCLPDDHGAKLNKLEVKRMALNSLRGALKHVRELTCGKQAAN